MNMPPVSAMLAAALAVASALVVPPSASAQDVDMVRWTVAGGGDVFTRSQEGGWEMSGTLGEWAASGPQQGSSWTLTGGFWAGATVASEGTTLFRDGFEGS